jgi:nicotinamide phosphoribosyltransferase
MTLPLGYELQESVVYGNFMAMMELVLLFDNTFFSQPLGKVAPSYVRRVNGILGENQVGIEHIEALHALGYLPLRVKSLPEGMRVPAKIPTLTVTNTVEEFFWLVNYIETPFSNLAWKPATVATIAGGFRDLLEEYANITGAPKEAIGFQCHDFSCRGMSGPEDAARSGTGHLVFFEGTDSIGAIDQVEFIYGDNSETSLIGASVPATEHSVMCMGGKESEYNTFYRMLQLYPTGYVSIVSDTWDYWKVLTKTSVELKPLIMAREGTVVFRPDSGNPIHVLAGYHAAKLEASDIKGNRVVVELGEHVEVVQLGSEYFMFNQADYTIGEWISEAEVKGSVEVLWDIFGGTTNAGGYRFLDSHVGLIYGDSITIPRADEILNRLAHKGFGSTNVVFGIGSYTYQYLTRDNLGFAMKAVYGITNGEAVEIFKDPITDKGGVKKSAKGLVRVDYDHTGQLCVYDQQTIKQENEGLLGLIFEDGVFYNEPTFAEIRKRARSA